MPSVPMSSLPSRWHAPATLSAAIPAAWRPWLLSTDSLTQRLVTASSAPLRVQIVYEGLRRPRWDEAQRLNLAPGQLAWVREVLLVSGDTPWVAARSVTPRGSAARRLRRQGTRPLGAWLFAQGDIVRSPIELSRSRVPFMAEPARWGRRSVFQRRRDARFRLLVQEYFLAAMGEALALP